MTACGGFAGSTSSTSIAFPFRSALLIAGFSSASLSAGLTGKNP
jgi:hypothetical protein